MYKMRSLKEQRGHGGLDILSGGLMIGILFLIAGALGWPPGFSIGLGIIVAIVCIIVIGMGLIILAVLLGGTLLVAVFLLLLVMGAVTLLGLLH